MEKLLLCTILLSIFSLEILADANLPEAPLCGKSNLPSLRGRVFNGSITNLNEYPWLVYLESLFTVLEIPVHVGSCTSSLISSDWVLTAAHCIFYPNAYEYPQIFKAQAQVTLGEWNTVKDPDCDENKKCAPKSIKLGVIGVNVHSNYYTEGRYDFKYDIALLRLERSAKFSPYVQPICLPLGPTTEQSTSNYEGLKVTITGWGRFNHNTYSSHIKRKAVVTVTDYKPCHEWYGEEEELSEKYQLCVGGADGGACNGDSGGPLLLESESEKNTYYQIGVASLGRQECINITRPTVYVRVDAYIDWISRTVQNDNYVAF